MTDEPIRESRRDERRAARLQQARGTVTPARIRVLPRDEEFRKTHRNIVGHPDFPAEGSVEWPHDQYTKRRLRDGDVTIEEAPPEGRRESHEPTPREARAVKPTSEPPRS